MKKGANIFEEDQALFTGALEDNRSEADKAKDYRVEEIASANPVVWREIDFDNLPSYPIRDQDGSGSCVAQTLALMLGIENLREEGRFIEFSASDIYRRRVNQGGAGMVGFDAMEIGRKYGATLEEFMPSQDLNEREINLVPRSVSDEQLGPIFRSGGYVQVPFNIDYMASLMEQYRVNGTAKPLMTWYRFNRKEWTPEPKVLNLSRDLHHSVTGIEYGLLKGRKVIVTQDSWGLSTTTKGGLRFIDENFIKNRMTFCSMLHDMRNDWRDNEDQGDKPVYRFSNTFEFGLMGHPDVIALQNILKYEGLFPTTVQSTGNYLQITAKAILEWQKKHQVASLAELESLQGRVVGPKTIKELNKLYA